MDRNALLKGFCYKNSDLHEIILMCGILLKDFDPSSANHCLHIIMYVDE